MIVQPLISIGFGYCCSPLYLFAVPFLLGKPVSRTSLNLYYRNELEKKSLLIKELKILEIPDEGIHGRRGAFGSVVKAESYGVVGNIFIIKLL